MVLKREFGTLPNGDKINNYMLMNNCGEYVEILDYGASLHSLYVKDKTGRFGDVVQGVKDAEDLPGPSREGSVIGRVANRIAWGKYVHNGKSVKLETNRGDHFLHGGSGNYAHKIFRGEENGENSVSFYYKDTGEGGFDCEADVKITYTLNNDHCLSIVYEILPYGDTPLNPTNHAYFNLSVDGDGRDHILSIYSDHVALNGPTGMPEGGSLSVEGTALDFRSPRVIREAMKGEPGTYDESYLLHKRDDNLAAELYSPESGRLMRIYTDMPALQLFLHPGESKHQGKHGEKYPPYSSVCLEPGFVPNSINCSDFDSPLVHGGERFISRSDYVFSVR